MEFTHIARIKPNDKNGMTKYIFFISDEVEYGFW